jgi:hypothetical protein
MTPGSAPRAGITAVVIVAVLSILGVLGWWSDRRGEAREQVDPSPPTPWAEEEVRGRWMVLYTGYGDVTGGDQELTLSPRSADAPDVTHAALVHTTQECLDADFALTVRTESQVRLGTPNPWEVGWVLWNFRDNLHFYAVALKPNGWEISKQDPDYPGSQRFIAASPEPQFPIGADYRVAVSQDWPRMTVTVDGQELATVTDDESPYRGGAVGLYTEDARVRFSSFDLPECLTP